MLKIKNVLKLSSNRKNNVNLEKIDQKPRFLGLFPYNYRQKYKNLLLVRGFYMLFLKKGRFYDKIDKS